MLLCRTCRKHLFCEISTIATDGHKLFLQCCCAEHAASTLFARPARMLQTETCLLCSAAGTTCRKHPYSEISTIPTDQNMHSAQCCCAEHAACTPLVRSAQQTCMSIACKRFTLTCRYSAACTGPRIRSATIRSHGCSQVLPKLTYSVVSCSVLCTMSRHDDCASVHMCCACMLVPQP